MEKLKQYAAVLSLIAILIIAFTVSIDYMNEPYENRTVIDLPPSGEIPVRSYDETSSGHIGLDGNEL